jgi:nucleoside-diphosphate-sugar epimerase
VNILVTGASGFVGSHIANELLNQGHKVTCLAHNGDIKGIIRKLNKLPYEVICSPQDISRFDKVYHIAGVLGKRGIPLSVYQEAHINLTERLLKQINKNQEFIYMSTGWVKYPTKPYQKTKIIGEEIVRNSNIPYVIVRSGFVLGEGDYHHLPLFRMINRLKQFCPIIGDGTNRISPVYVKDVVNYILNPPSNTFYLCGCNVQVSEFIKMIAKALNVSSPFITTGFLKGLVNAPYINDLLKLEFFTKDMIIDVQPNCTPLDIVLDNTVKWYRDNKLL